MKVKANSVEEYINSISEERKKPFTKLMAVIRNNLPKGFEELLNYGMIGYVVSKNKYPKGYHCNPDLPLPFINIASQKNYIAIYHMGLYASKDLFNWFVDEYTSVCNAKPDIGKSCLRLKKMDNIPYELIAELCKKMTTSDWISLYEKSFIK